MKILELKNISKTYDSHFGKIEIFRNLNLSIDRKQNIFLFGPSGCGKSTLLNIVAGLDSPDNGEIYYQDNLINKFDNNHLKNDLGIIFQDQYLISELNVKDNIKLKNDNIDQIHSILEFLKIEDLVYKFPNQLSNGQKQRVCVARALVGNPKLIIADEPTSYLDRENADLVIKLILEASNKFKLSAIIASHDISFKAYFDKSISIIDKNLVQC